MKQTSYTTRVLVAENGHKLTQAADGISDMERTVSSKVYLAPDASPNDWREITDDEALIIQAARDAAINAQRIAIEAESSANIQQSGHEDTAG